MSHLERLSILNEISQERERQDKKFGSQTGQVTLSRLATITGEELGEATQIINDLYELNDKGQDRDPIQIKAMLDALDTELIQTAACAVKAVEILRQWRQNGGVKL